MFQFEVGAGAGQLAAMQVLVTGAFGRLGQEVLRRLVGEGHAAVAFDLPTKANRRLAKRFEKDVRIVWGDIRSREDVDAVVNGCGAIIHNAGILAPLTEQKPDLAHAVNVVGTENLIAAMSAQRQPPRLVYASTSSVCGPRVPGGPPLTANDPALGTDHYTSHKIECERIIRESSLPWVIFRIGVSVSAQAKDFSPDIFRLLFEIDPRTRLEYVHPRDVSLAQMRATLAPDALGKILMIGGGESCRMTFKDFYAAIFGASGVGELPAAAYGKRPYYCDWIDTTESQAILQFQEHTFDDFIREFRHESRWTRPIVRLFSPLIRRYLLRYSDAWQSHKH
ncbi:MAG: NAD(P)-dependent oxidoreductase [Myxococcales bacterium]|nr:NAD(P)-dependent oxidoreductase [Myxococcales bacterium]MDH3844078.1 NAD(P)-dependent oxidoreductase [Myxococcales bacterium]